MFVAKLLEHDHATLKVVFLFAENLTVKLRREDGTK